MSMTTTAPSTMLILELVTRKGVESTSNFRINCVVRRSRVRRVFVVGVPGRLELERAVLDVEMPGQALLQLVQQARQMPVVETGLVHYNMRGQDRQIGRHRRR